PAERAVLVLVEVGKLRLRGGFVQLAFHGDNVLRLRDLAVTIGVGGHERTFLFVRRVRRERETEQYGRSRDEDSFLHRFMEAALRRWRYHILRGWWLNSLRTN